MKRQKRARARVIDRGQKSPHFGSILPAIANPSIGALTTRRLNDVREEREKFEVDDDDDDDDDDDACGVSTRLTWF